MTFEVRFDLERPDRAPIVVPRAEIDFALADGTQRHATVTNDSHTSMSLPAGTCTVNVHAGGFLHHEQSILVEPDSSKRGHEGGDVRSERLVLWPIGAQWIAVVVQTRDGRPFRALAEDLGVEPKRLFVGAFGVRVRLSAPIEGAPEGDTRELEDLATFHTPPGYQSFELPGNIVGWLELERDPPMWAELLLFGVSAGVEVIRPGDSAVVFHLDQAAYDTSCARVVLRVLDARTRNPLPDARVTLRADTSAHRRKDQENAAVDGNGRVEFARVQPGKYELTVMHGDDMDQRRIDLAAKQVLDVGDVLIEQRGHVDLLVVDEEDHPQSAWIEIAPYGPGKGVDELYPPMLHSRSDSSGKFRLSLPAKRSIVRARIEGNTSRGQPADGPRSANLLLDPEKLPAQPWKIVVREPIPTTFEIGLRDVKSVEVSDEIGILDVWPSVDSKGRATCELISGRHHARYLDEHGTVRNEQDFTIAKDAAVVRSP